MNFRNAGTYRLNGSALALFLLCCTGSSAAATIEYSCIESSTTKGVTPRMVMVKLDLGAEKAFVETSAGGASGLLQTTLDLFVGRLETKAGKVFVLSIHRFTGRISLMAEQPKAESEKKPEFSGVCTAK